MAAPQLTPQQIAQICRLVAEYIVTQRGTFFPRALRLTAVQRAAMAGFFAPQLLNGLRVLVLEGIRVQNPPFYPVLAGNAGAFWPIPAL